MMHRSDTRTLRLALAGNAVFSLISASLLVSMPRLVGGWLGGWPSWVLVAIGAGLLVFGADLLHQATRRRVATWRALYASLADFAWVAGTVVLLLVPGVFSRGGAILALGVAAVVLGFGIVQMIGIGRAHRVRSGVYRHCILVGVDAPTAAMWGVIGRIGDIHRYMPMLQDSCVLDDREPGPGAVRSCTDRAGRHWSEECTEFREGEGFTVRFLTDEPGFPFPARSMRGGWEVRPAGNGSTVQVWWELEPSSKLPAPVLMPMLGLKADLDFPKVIRRMAEAASPEGQSSWSARERGLRGRLLPRLC
ncbi:MAG: SRPBCC family protein [Phycisphaerales bacterium]|nr:SRPBCC family protein [Phycisphaerales bacterium]